MSAWEPGLVLAVKTGGVFAKVIRYGQEIAHDPWWEANHVVVTDASPGWCIEAAPSGTRTALMDYEVLATVRPPDPLACLAKAHELLGTPYGWVDIAAFSVLCVSEIQDGQAPTWLQTRALKRMKDESTLVCSQVGAKSLLAGGFPLPDDPLLFKPADIARLAR